MERLVNLLSRRRIPFQHGLHILLLTLFFFSLTQISSAAPLVSASIQPGSFSVNESATLTITIHEGKGVIDQLPKVDGLSFENRGQSSQRQFINGSLSSRMSTIFQVQAARAGQFTIPPVSVIVDGKRLQTQVITFEVTAASAGSSPIAQPGDDTEKMAFLRVTPVKGKSYTGEVLPIQIKAYFRQNLQVRMDSQPRLIGDGVILALASQNAEQTEEMLGGVPYSALVWSGSLSPVKSGEHKLRIGVEASAFLPVSRPNMPRGGADPFFGNDIFSDFFNQHAFQEKQLNLLSKEFTLPALALPQAGRPPGFSGAIGRFELDVTANPTDARPGDPIALTMTVRGTGNIDKIEAPVLSEQDGWKSYSPSAKFMPGQKLGQGSKIFEQAVIAGNADKKAIPPLVFSFFDPESGSYQTIRSQAIPLHTPLDTKSEPEKKEHPEALRAEQPSETEAQDGSEKINNHNILDDKSASSAQAPLQIHPGFFQKIINPLVANPVFQIIVLISLLALIAAIALKIQRGRRNNNPLHRQRHEKARLLEKRTGELTELSQQGNSRDFPELCRRSIQEQLGLLWRMEPEAITLSDLRKRLSADSMLIELFAWTEDCAYGAAAQSLSSQEMTEVVRKLKNELKKLNISQWRT